jgi:hypothetical protein
MAQYDNYCVEANFSLISKQYLCSCEWMPACPVQLIRDKIAHSQQEKTIGEILDSKSVPCSAIRWNVSSCFVDLLHFSFWFAYFTLMLYLCSMSQVDSVINVPARLHQSRLVMQACRYIHYKIDLWDMKHKYNINVKYANLKERWRRWTKRTTHISLNRWRRYWFPVQYN